MIPSPDKLCIYDSYILWQILVQKNKWADTVHLDTGKVAFGGGCPSIGGSLYMYILNPTLGHDKVK